MEGVGTVPGRGPLDHGFWVNFGRPLLGVSLTHLGPIAGQCTFQIVAREAAWFADGEPNGNVAMHARSDRPR